MTSPATCGRVRALARRFDSIEIDDSSPERSKSRSPSTSRVSIGKNRSRKVAVTASKPKVSRRRSSLMKKSNSQQQIASASDCSLLSVPKSQSINVRLSEVSEEGLDQTVGSLSSPMPSPQCASSPLLLRAKPPLPPSKPKVSPKPKPTAPPKPAKLTPGQSPTRSQSNKKSPDYQTYDSDFSNLPKSLNSSATEVELPDINSSSDEMQLVGSDIELSGNIYQSVNGILSAPDSNDHSKTESNKCAESPPALPPRNSIPPVTSPKPPKSPPPLPPKKLSVRKEFADDSGEYEDIDDELLVVHSNFLLPQNSITNSEVQSVSGGSSGSWETASVQSSSSAGEKPKLLSFKRVSSDSSAFLPPLTSQSDQCSYQTIDEKSPDHKEKASISTTFGTTIRNKKMPKLKNFRPLSQPSIDGLLRIKSDIRVNLKKQVGKIKLKVTSATPESLTLGRKRKKKAKSDFYCGESAPESYSSPVSPSEGMVASIQFPLDSDVYDDDWSDSDHWSDEETTDTENNIEEEEKIKQDTQTLPDLVSCTNEVEILAIEDVERIEIEDDGTSTLRGSYYQERPPSPAATVTESTTSSSCQDHGRDDVTTSGAPSSGDLQPLYNSRFSAVQPLYQHYMMDQITKIQRMDSISSTRTSGSVSSFGTINRERLSTAGSAFGSQRSLWCELPEVLESGLLDALTKSELKQQEAMFEVITSEASYLRSLNVLITHFMAAPEFSGNKALSTTVIDKRERKHLFSNILSVRDCSEKLLSNLEALLEENLVLNNVCEILSNHFEIEFEPYVKYCSNQMFQDRTLRNFKAENPLFLQAVQRLELTKECQGLDMRSFLTLPTQRVTRYPLLVVAILERTNSSDLEKHQNAQRALHLANQLVSRCNEGARRMERMEQLLEIDNKLRYKSGDPRRLPLVGSTRHLVKQGELQQLIKPSGPLSLRKGSLGLSTLTATARRKNKRLYLFLFTDLLLVTKKKVNTYTVKDYCTRAFVEVAPLEPSCAEVPPAALASLPAHLSRRPHLFMITLMQNSRGKQIQLVLCAETETDRERWLSAMRPPVASNPEEKIYAEWDCPQVQATYEYIPTQEDELKLIPGDIVNVRRKMKDGWYEGEKFDQNASGWFPSSYVTEVLNDHVRAKHYRQRLQFLSAVEKMQFDSNAKTNTNTVVKLRGGTEKVKEKIRRMTQTSGIFQL